jgi:hypothetical protein
MWNKGQEGGGVGLGRAINILCFCSINNLWPKVHIFSCMYPPVIRSFGGTPCEGIAFYKLIISNSYSHGL